MGIQWIARIVRPLNARRYLSLSIIMKKHRPDITHALIHLIGDRISIGGLSADEALYSILKSREVERKALLRAPIEQFV